MTTLAEYKARGGYVANVPGDIGWVQTRPKAIRKQIPPNADWPEGTVETHFGPEMLRSEIIEGRRVVRFTDLQDFKDLIAGQGAALAWERANPELMRVIANQAISNKPPGAIWE